MIDPFETPQTTIELSRLTFDELNMRVTELIISAERLSDASGDFSEISTAWAEVSAAEEVIADKAPDNTEKQFAQRGAVMAAQKSGDHVWVVALFEKYGPGIWMTESESNESA